MTPADWPYVVSVTCHKHKKVPSKTRRVSKGPESMTLGQRVIGRNNDGWYYHCTIIGMATQIFYEVNFDDGSYCDNLHPENVLSHDCLRSGPPDIGELIVVAMPNGQDVNASFVRSHTHNYYQVEFQNQSQQMVKPSELHHLDQELPKRVRARLAIPGNQDGPSADGAQAAKRPRLPSGSAPCTKTAMEIVEPSCPLTAPAEHDSISTPLTSQHSTTPDKGFQMDMSATPSVSASDPMLTPQSTPFQSMLNLDPLLSAPSPPPPPQHMVDNYILSTGYVSYMETLLSSHFPQDDEPAALY